MKWLGLALGVVVAACGAACGKGAGSGGGSGSGTQSEEAKEPPPPPPAPGLAEAAVVSLPRDRWPCAVTYRSVGGRRLSRLMVYGEVETCVVPISEYRHTLGGCPVKQHDGAFTYDAQGRLVESFLGNTYEWTERGPASLHMSRTRLDFERKGDWIVLSDRGAVDDRFSLGPEGRLVRHEDVLRSSGATVAESEFEYEGERVARIRKAIGGVRDDMPTIVQYDCSNLPPDDPDPDADAAVDPAADAAAP